MAAFRISTGRKFNGCLACFSPNGSNRGTIFLSPDRSTVQRRTHTRIRFRIERWQRAVRTAQPSGVTSVQTVHPYEDHISHRLHARHDVRARRSRGDQHAIDQREHGRHRHQLAAERACDRRAALGYQPAARRATLACDGGNGGGQTGCRPADHRHSRDDQQGSEELRAADHVAAGACDL